MYFSSEHVLKSAKRQAVTLACPKSIVKTLKQRPWMLCSFFDPELEVGVCPQAAYFLKVLSANPTL